MSHPKFCASCGTAIAVDAGFCSGCGTPVALAPAAAPAPAPQAAPAPTYAQPQQPYQQQAYYAPPKNKNTAVLLAVFLGWWSWLYTFKLNKAKFFIGLGSSFVIWIIQFSTLASMNRSTSLYQACLDDYLYGTTTLDECTQYQPNYTGVIIAGLLSFGVWLWCLLDNARKPHSFYQNFPNEK